MVHDITFPKSFVNKILESSSSRTKIRTSAANREDALKWMKEYEALSNTKWRIRSTYPNGVRFAYKCDFVCQHSSFNKRKVSTGDIGLSKDSACPAALHIKTDLITKGTMRNNAFVKVGLPTIVEFLHEHNHHLNSAAALSMLPGTSEAFGAFEAYFDNGMGVPEAIKYHTSKLELNRNEHNLASGSVNPKQRTVQHWFTQWRLRHLGPHAGRDMITVLESKLGEYANLGHIVVYREDPFAIVIVTAIMKRAHQLPLSSEIVFADSTASCNAENHSLTFLLTPCPAGAVPLAVLITSGQSINDYVAAFGLLKDALGESGFRGQLGPNIFIVDDSEAEMSAISQIWPHAFIKLCLFHVPQAVWRWLWDSKHLIANIDRKKLMSDFQMLIRIDSAVDAETLYESLINTDIWKKYPQWISHVGKYWDRKQLWCMAWRDASMHGHQTNNFCEATIRIFKDIVLGRCKAYNCISLVDFVCDVMESYYRNRLLTFAHSRVNSATLLLKAELKKCQYITSMDQIQYTGQSYLVPSEDGLTEPYTVDTVVGACTCRVGRFGEFCKHQAAVWKFFGEDLFSLPPVTQDARYQVAVLALGKEAEPKSFYDDFSNVRPSDVLAVDVNDEVLLATDNADTSNVPYQVANLALDKEAKPKSFYDDFSNVRPSNVLAVDVNDEVLLATDNADTSNVAVSTDEFAPVSDMSTSMDRFNIILKEMEQLHVKFGSSEVGINRMLSFLRSVSTATTWEGFLQTQSSRLGVGNRRSSAIRVQPTALARRRSGVTRGSKRLPAGRPPSSQASKRPKHCLAKNISSNNPNAKQHGQAH